MRCGFGEFAEVGNGAEDVDGLAFAFEDHAEGAADVFFVVDDEDAL